MSARQQYSARAVLSARLKRLFKTRQTAGRKAMQGDWFGGNIQRSYMVMPGQPVWMDRNYVQFSHEAYIKNVIAYRCVNMVAWAAASLDYTLYSINAKGGRRELKAHPVLDLLRRPSPKHARSSFFHELYNYLLIGGNAYMQAIGPKDQMPSELYLLRPDRVAVLAGKGALPMGYRYSVNGQNVDFPVDSITGRSRILHLKTFNPLNDWYGLSPIEAAAYSIDQHNQSGAWNQALLQNGARPSGALVVRGDKNGAGQSLSEDQYTRIKQQIDEQFTGASNAGRPILLEGGLDWKEMSMSPRDMDFIEAKHAAARDIALAFGVPPQLLGIPGDNTYSNLQEARLALWEQTILPLAQNVIDSLGGWLQKLYADRLELVIDTDNVSALATRNQAIWDRLEKASFLTDDEKRAAVGYGPKSNTAVMDTLL